MKRIINGKVYDTDTAKLVGEWDNGFLPTDLDYIHESLYRKRTGEYFVAGEGGARTKYAIIVGNERWSGSSNILPMDDDTARQWAEEHLDADTVLKWFDLPLPKAETLSIRLTPDARAKLDAYMEQTGQTAGKYISALILNAD